LPDVPILALTASATPEVRHDICEKLAFREQNVFRQSFERANLSYSVFKVDSRINKIIEILKNVPGCGIVYCKSRKRTKEIADLIQMHGMSADFYHAGLSQDERNARQESWIKDQIRIIVCTNAFGMGIDKPDVRVVIHADSPDCLENYYQEAGRGGRDGKRSYAVLLYGSKDVKELKDSIQVRYPQIEYIRQVYQAMSNYLQIPSGSGREKYYDFDFNDFIKKFRLNSKTVLYSIKALEQDEWLSFNEQVFIPSTVRFSTSKEYLYQFEKDNPVLEPMIKTLLRSYEGIFDYPASVSENTLAFLLKKEKGEIINQLVSLHRNQIIEYTPQKDTPQLLFLRDRIKTEDLSINIKALNSRKEKFTERVDKMTNYLSETILCRSRVIGSYFGDNELKDCGICDNCLKQKSVQLTREEFELISNRIMDSMKNKPLHSKNLAQLFKGINREKTWKVINYLQAENKIVLDKGGWIKLK
ncbi:MAG TPA: helicase-related protein, partial [Chitinophagaceae bacterium]